MSSIVLILVLGLIFINGAWIYKKSNSNLKSSLISFICLSILIGLSQFILASHLLALLIHSFTQAMYFVLIPMLVLAVFALKNYRNTFAINKPELGEIILILVSMLLSLLCFLRNQLMNIGDAQHLAYSANIAMNDYYPPRLLINKDIVFNFYHYGIDLVGAFFQIFAKNIDPFTLNGAQLAIAAFLLPILLFKIINSDAENKKYSLLACISIILFTSINSLDFLVREILNMKQYELFEFIKDWLMNSQVSTDALSGCSNSLPILFGLVYLLILILQTIQLESNQQQNFYFYLSVLGVSFMSYFIFPAYLLTLGASYFVIKFLFNFSIQSINKIQTIFQNPTVIFFVMICLGKLLTFTGSQSKINGIEAMSFKPHLTWTVGYLRYLSYFYKPEYLFSLGKSYEERAGRYKFEVPLFSSLSFREFGFMILLALVIFLFIWGYKKRSLSFIQKLLMLSSLVSLAPVFLFEFCIAPIELTRFLFPAKLYAMIFVAISLYALEKEFKFFSKRKILRFILPVCLVISLLPGLANFIPNERFAITGYRFNKTERSLVKMLKSNQRSGRVILHYDEDQIPWAYDCPLIAGFYDIGGVLLKPEYTTQKTALYTLNPRLLEELRVDFILIHKNNALSKAAEKRLEDPNLFKLVDKIPDKAPYEYRLYKFVATTEKINQYANDDYVWILGYQDATREFHQFDSEHGKFIFPSREQSQFDLGKARELLLKSDKAIAIYATTQALPSPQP